MKAFKIISGSIGGLIVLIALIFGLQYFGLVSYSFFSPRYQNVQRKVFENTQSFTEGKKKDLVKYYDEWRQSDEVGKEALRGIVIDDFANFNPDYFTPQERDMYNQICGN